MKSKIKGSSFANYTFEQNIDAMQCKFLLFRVRPMHNDGLRVGTFQQEMLIFNMIFTRYSDTAHCFNSLRSGRWEENERGKMN
jgi:hypothetical protein